MPEKKRLARGLPYAVVSLVLIAVLLQGCKASGERSGPAGAPPPLVSVMEVQPRSVALFSDFAAQTYARNMVDVRSRVAGYGSRKRVGEAEGLFENRKIAYEPVELTSRVSTDKVAEAKRRLAQVFSDKDHVDVALATNIISVGLDIVRLGLMVVSGQPKTSAE